MTQIQTLKKGDETIYPLTHMKGVVDDNGNTMDVLLAEAEKKALRKLFIAAGAEYNDTDQIIQKTAPWGTEEKWRLEDDGTYTYWEEPAIVEHLPKHYYLNGLGDITEEQMIEIYNQRWQISQNIANMFALSNIRTNFLPQNKGLRKLDVPSGIYAKGAFQSCVNAEVLILCIQILVNNTQIYSLQVGYGASMFNANKKLKHVIGTFSCESVADTATLITMFRGCKSLKTVNIYNCNKEISFAECPNISKKSVLYTIQNAAPTAAITITLHPDAYARIANQPDILEALEAQTLVTLVSA